MAAEERKPLHLEGTVEHVMYCNAENGYTVLELDAGGTLITVVGEMGETEEGEQLSVDGEYAMECSSGRSTGSASCRQMR